MRKVQVLLILTVLFWSCASGGAPQWVNNPPEDSADSVYFTGIGTSGSGNEQDARDQAVYGIVGEITRYIGVKISSEVSVTAKDTLEEFQSTIEQNIKQSSNARIEEFRIADQYIEKKDGQVTVYLLGEYDKQSLEKEKKRIQNVFAEQQAAVSGPEYDGDNLASREQYFAAALKYIEAAGAAGRSDIDNKDIKFERNINKAKDAFQRLRIELISGEYTGNKDASIPPLKIRVVSDSSVSQEGVGLRVTYRELGAGNRFRTITTEVRTNASGIAEFRLPVPKFVGEEKVIISFEIRAALETVVSLPDRYLELVDGLEVAANTKKEEYTYTIVSPLAGMRMVLAGEDLDGSSNVIRPSEITTGMMEVFGSSDFVILKTDYPEIDASPGETGQILAEQQGLSSGRVILGEARVLDYSEEDNKKLVQVGGNGYLIDIASGAVLYTTESFQKRAIGNSTQAALVSAFRQLGKMIGEDLLNNLR